MKQGDEEHTATHPDGCKGECNGEDTNDEEAAFEHLIPFSSPHWMLFDV
jgi:hypothetical protein